MQSFVRFHAIESETGLSQGFGGENRRAAPPLLSYLISNFIIAISNNVDFLYKFLYNMIHWKPRSTYPKKFVKSVTTVQRFSPKVDRHPFMLE